MCHLSIWLLSVIIWNRQWHNLCTISIVPLLVIKNDGAAFVNWMCTKYCLSFSECDFMFELIDSLRDGKSDQIIFSTHSIWVHSYIRFLFFFFYSIQFCSVSFYFAVHKLFSWQIQSFAVVSEEAETKMDFYFKLKWKKIKKKKNTKRKEKKKCSCVVLNIFCRIYVNILKYFDFSVFPFTFYNLLDYKI